ncbi:MAG: DMT family transporter [Janthinobacterium lividum]
MSSKFRIHAALLLANLIYAANYSFSKDVMPTYMLPFGIVTLRVIGAGLFFTVLKFLVARQDKIVGRADNLRSILCGICGIGLNQLLFFSGLNLTAPISASLLQTIAPIVVLLASVALLGERLTLWRVLGIAVGAAGAVALIRARPVLGATVYPQATLGNLYILANATVFGLYLVLVAPLMRKYHAFTVLSRIFLVGACLIVPMGWQQALAADYAHFPLKIWVEIGYMVFCLTILAYLLNNWALKFAPPSLLGVYIYLQPVMAVLIAVALHKDTFSWVKAGQAALIFLGVWLVSRKPAPATPPEAVAK